METGPEVVKAAQLYCECGNCGHVCSQSQLRDIKDYHMRVDFDGPEPSGECPQCGALSYQVTDPAVPMRSVRIKLVALVRKEYSETLSVPAAMTSAQLHQLVHARYQAIDADAFEDDPEYWERGHCDFESAEPTDDVTGIVSVVDGRITVIELPKPSLISDCPVDA